MRLIDADALKKSMAEAIKDAPLYIQETVDQYIDEAPTLTPPNEPLTQDDVNEMHFDRVWIDYGTDEHGKRDGEEGIEPLAVARCVARHYCRWHDIGE